MTEHALRGISRDRRGGALLDVIAGALLLLAAAYAFDAVGLTLPVLLHSFRQFLGV